MPSDSIFHFDSTYLNLPEKFHSKINFEPVPNPEWVLRNDALFKEMNIGLERSEDLLQILAGNKLDSLSTPFAQAYAGHQFGHFTMLGDGRGTLLGEHLTSSGKRLDIQLKGSGPTPYSRRGDGRATLRSMLKEYIISEAMHHLGIPTSRSLAVVKSGEKVYREEIHEGAILTRVMQSHIRVGTFEFARYYGGVEDVQILLDYTIDRLYPELKETENKSLAFLDKVMKIQIDLIINWMRVGFIHGVMNTDNTSISGETFDYGPCAFMGVYDPNTVFSSIDRDGRYSFDNQPKILKWNLARLAETLIPLIHPDEKIAIELATNKINEFDAYFRENWYKMMLAKLGISTEKEGDSSLVDEFLQLLYTNKMDYTHSFTYLRTPEIVENQEFSFPNELQNWRDLWQKRIHSENQPFELMEKMNPVFIPRNYYMEKAIQKADEGDLTETINLINIINGKKGISVKSLLDFNSFEGFDEGYMTFCET